ncbi:LOW QUALITY PROTEIN: translation factor GUF1 homolog, mitochondrial-like [Rutidosis leptorrhynchoides]|uniref:LOW QUALITY PROTEIN: translation factor GUF1 homolog, mitochondrial-like n=1 Tax=Rutidosis leptorrhynchoides TaxID=125765 RepID=UPI003A9921C2
MSVSIKSHELLMSCFAQFWTCVVPNIKYSVLKCNDVALVAKLSLSSTLQNPPLDCNFVRRLVLRCNFFIHHALSICKSSTTLHFPFYNFSLLRFVLKQFCFIHSIHYVQILNNGNQVLSLALTAVMGSLYRASRTIKSQRCFPLINPFSLISRTKPLYSVLNNFHCHTGGTYSFCTHSRQNNKETNIDLSQFPTEKIRNFSIIAHVDHGKSTLADRLLELTGTIKKGIGQPQYLDKLQVERERGITVKAQTATMFYSNDSHGPNVNDRRGSQTFLLNLIDTPGHVDFSYEVSRSLAACQGALLVVDAVQGVQAQTVANFYLAFESNLMIIPIINKIDQPTADPDRVKAQLKSMFDLEPTDCLLTSAKTGWGLEQVLPAVIERMPPPPGKSDSPLRMLLLDSYYDEYKGVICHVAVVDGVLRKGDKISSASSGHTYEALDVGIMHPELKPTGVLLTGQVGYVVSGMRSTKEARIGDTLHHYRKVVEPLPGFKAAKHMVFSGLFSADGSDFEALNNAIERLTCNDASVSVSKESSTALGLVFRCGFLGLLHMDVFHQRLEQEYGAHVISTAPTVPYIFEYSDGSKAEVQNPAALPSTPQQRVTASWEPTVLATIIIPSEYVGPIITLCSERRGEQLEYTFIDSLRVFMKYRLPLREIVVDFYNELKSLTSGYASFDYEDSEYQKSDLVKLDILLNGQPVDAMATIVHKLKAQRVGRECVEKLKKFIDRQMFEITIQAAIGSKVIARETISAMRKNVLAKCYGGDVTRKRKLLEKQKEGKKRMKRVGSVDIPQEAFHEILKVS